MSIDRPSKDMFSLFKRKHTEDFIPLIILAQGVQAKYQEENLNLIQTSKMSSIPLYIVLKKD